MSDNLVSFSSIREGEPFENPKTRSVYTKQTDLVHNAVSASGVKLRFKPTELVKRLASI